ncbi:unnamed protein product [Rotaria sordida]|uniref:Uncharacterized protein n=1 Tax=Rotaria sordida TaxID=392033 RepID=A0A815H2Y9_9BILA|nr:unnamed protein product [Rotaria sordida]CAF1348622.1 unnamed protein product [Rotaria sordida]
MARKYDIEKVPTIQQSDTAHYVPSTKIGRGVQYVRRNSKNAFITAFVFIALFALLALIFAVPIVQVYIGFTYKNSCPINHLIPIYLIIAGFVTLALLIISGIKLCFEESLFWSILQFLFGLVCLGWFITGSVWIFRAKGKVQYYYPYYESTFCDYTLFNCAFGTLFISYGFLFGLVCNNDGNKK